MSPADESGIKKNSTRTQTAITTPASNNITQADLDRQIEERWFERE